LLELGEAAFDEVALGIEVVVDCVLFRARGIVRDHGCGALDGVGLLPLSSFATSPTSSRNLAWRCFL
jgi:hypothetical protein